MASVASRNPSVEELVLRLHDLREGPNAVAAVVASGEAAIPALEALLRGRAESVYEPRCLAADALAAIGGSSAALSLVRALEDSASRVLSPVLHEAECAVVNRVADLLGATGDPRAADALLGALAIHPYPGCVRALGRLGEARAAPLFVRCLFDGFAREPAAEALRRLGPVGVPHLVRALARSDAEPGYEGALFVAGRAAAAALLADLGGEEANLPLVWALHDAQPHVRFEVALGLCRRSAEAGLLAVAVLVEALGAEDWVRAQAAEDALTCLGEAVVEELAASLVDESDDAAVAKRRKLRGLGVLARIGTTRCTDILVRFLDDADPALRYRAALTLGEREETLAQIAPLLADPNAEVRAAVQERLRAKRSEVALALRAVARGVGIPRGARGLRARWLAWRILHGRSP